jgi:hypothetical protein
MSPWVDTAYVLCVGLFISGISVFYQSKVLKWESKKEKDKAKLKFSEDIRWHAIAFMGSGAFGALLVALVMALPTLCSS